MTTKKQQDLETAEDAHPDEVPSHVPVTDEPPEPTNAIYYTIGSVAPGESPWDVASYLWGKGSFAAQLVQANMSRDWEDGVEIVVPDLEF
jgi:hypothetical protein